MVGRVGGESGCECLAEAGLTPANVRMAASDASWVKVLTGLG